VAHRWQASATGTALPFMATLTCRGWLAGDGQRSGPFLWVLSFI